MQHQGTITLDRKLIPRPQLLALEMRPTLNEQEPYGERDEVIVCMVLAFCIGNAIITLAYRLTA